ncbi:MAG: glutathione S-transferase family protein [Pseudomonadota bacterium]
MKLYDGAASPFCRKVKLLIAELERTELVEIIPALGNPVAPGSMPLAENPLGKIPCLIQDSMPALYDSRVICRYLNDLWDGGLYPTGPALWSTLTLEATADGMMEAAVLVIYEGRCREEGERSDIWVSAQKDKISRALQALEARWLSHLAGPVDMGVLGVAAALGYLDFRLPDWDWRGGHPGLATWYDAFAKRPAMLSTQPQ